MTNDRMEAVPAGGLGSGLFVSGVVLGLSIGFAAGHLLMFGRSRSRAQTADVAPVFPPFDPSMDLDGADESVPVSEDLAFFSLEFDEETDVGRVNLSEVADDDGLHYFPDVTHWGGEESDIGPRVAYAQSVASIASQANVELTATDGEAPKTIEPAPTALPIDEQTLQREQLTRSIIKDELPEATGEELDILCDVLQGLPANDIKGILRMRKRFGSRSSPAPGGLANQPAPLIRPEPPEPSRFGSGAARPLSLAAEEASTLRQLEEIAHHNYANRDTVAFKRIVPVLTEARRDGEVPENGVRLVRAIRDMSPGKQLATGRSFDVAIQREGFFQVRLGDEVRFTRDGRLQRNADGFLKLMASEEEWLLDPPIAIPRGAADLEVTSVGEVIVSGGDIGDASIVGAIGVVQFLNPESLESVGQGLFRSTEASGPPHPLPSEAVSLRQGFVEASNVDASRVLIQIKEQQTLLELMLN